MSEDKTREIVCGYTSRYGSVRLVDNPQKNIPAAFNIGIHNASGDTVMLLSAHSTCAKDYVRLCVTYQETYGVENVGGVLKMSAGAESAMARAIMLAVGHRFGSGNARAKVGGSKPTWADSAAFGCYKKELFSQIGFFDERLKSSSDMDLNVRIRAAGGRILFVPEIEASYYTDPNLRAFWKHNFADGVWTTYVLRFGSKAWSWRHWVPFAFVLSLLGSFALAAFLRPFLWLDLGIAAVYALTAITISLQLAFREHSFKLFFSLLPAFATRHIAHGTGALFGLVLVAIPGQLWRGRRGLKV
jgi:GT2 family glycosyltransferase